MSLTFCSWSSHSCSSMHVWWRVWILSCAAGTLSGMRSMWTEGFIPVINSWGVTLSVSCFHELWAYSAIGSSCPQLLGLVAHHGRRYCSSQAFIRSVCPSVRGWKAIDRFCLMPRALQRCVVNWLVNHGSLSEIILFGRPNMGTRWVK